MDPLIEENKEEKPKKWVRPILILDIEAINEPYEVKFNQSERIVTPSDVGSFLR
jgi:hypothetical protein